MGCLEYATGSHKEKKRSLPDGQVDPHMAHEDHGHEEEDDGAIRAHFSVWGCGDKGGEGRDGEFVDAKEARDRPYLSPGDVSFHHGWLLHRSGMHASLPGEGPRRVLVIRYVAGDAEILHPKSDPNGRPVNTHDQEANQWWMRGAGPMADPGELPVAFSKQHWWHYRVESHAEAMYHGA